MKHSINDFNILKTKDSANSMPLYSVVDKDNKIVLTEEFKNYSPPKSSRNEMVRTKSRAFYNYHQASKLREKIVNHLNTRPIVISKKRYSIFGIKLFDTYFKFVPYLPSCEWYDNFNIVYVLKGSLEFDRGDKLRTHFYRSEEVYSYVASKKVFPEKIILK